MLKETDAVIEIMESMYDNNFLSVIDEFNENEWSSEDEYHRSHIAEEMDNLAENDFPFLFFGHKAFQNKKYRDLAITFCKFYLLVRDFADNENSKENINRWIQ